MLLLATSDRPAASLPFQLHHLFGDALDTVSCHGAASSSYSDMSADVEAMCGQVASDDETVLSQGLLRLDAPQSTTIALAPPSAALRSECFQVISAELSAPPPALANRVSKKEEQRRKRKRKEMERALPLAPAPTKQQQQAASAQDIAATEAREEHHLRELREKSGACTYGQSLDGGI